MRYNFPSTLNFVNITLILSTIVEQRLQKDQQRPPNHQKDLMQNKNDIAIYSLQGLRLCFSSLVFATLASSVSDDYYY